ncbi:LOW QUALITY PROTEIN: hypothetical protein X943_003018 [Babesia divergens]|uniref:Uncharacterized protein n=1 Tax=Babesia divergens TaxID=32595 RepID=A0AAD9GM83_BABDI|nr:LOW QUALITY PROTEIN: hypothetical protein X943_003018 [Babesia divergens]
MEMGTDMKNVQIVKVDVAEVKEYGGPEYDNRDDEGKMDGPKEGFNDSQESLEGRTLDDKVELVKEVFDFVVQSLLPPLH